MRLETMSEAERAIYEEHLCFQRTKAGTSVYADLWVEITNKFLRHYCGHGVVGTEAGFLKEINGVLLCMDELQAGGGASGGSAAHLWDEPAAVDPEHNMKLGHAFSKTLEMVEKVNIWGTPGSDIYPIPRRKNAVQKTLACGAFVTIDGLALDKGFFSLLRQGDERAGWFRRAALMTGGWLTDNQPPNKPSTACIGALKATTRSDECSEWFLKWSHDHDELSSHNGATKPFVKQQIQELREQGGQGVTSAKMNKSELLKVLCKMRESAQEQNPPLEQEPVDSKIEYQVAGEADELMGHALMQ